MDGWLVLTYRADLIKLFTKGLEPVQSVGLWLNRFGVSIKTRRDVLFLVSRSRPL